MPTVNTALNSLSSTSTIPLASVNMEAPSEAESLTEGSEYHSHGGGIFSGSHHFTVAGGTFKNVTKTYVSAPDVPPHFRMIPLGDIDLQRQIRMDELGVENSGVTFREARECVRRVYSANVERKGDMTVAIYEGETAEEEWRRDIVKYMTVRHPHILQIYGAASSGRIHAAMFHGDLIPYQEFLGLYRHSPILLAYIRGYTTTQFTQTATYIYGIQGSSKTFQSIYEMVGTGMPSEYTLWIRRSSGLLCAEILPLQSDDKPIYYYPQSEGGEIPNGELSPNLSITEQEVRAIHRLSLQQYHDICSTTLSGCGYQSAPTSAMVTLGAVALLWRWGSDLVCVRDTEIYNTGWHDIIIGPTAPSLSHFNMADRSTRFKAADVLGKSLGLYFQDSHPWAVAMSIWLSQANHIFHRLQVIDNYDDCRKYVTNCVRFSIEIQPSSEAPPPGYLFLCPPSAFHAGYSSLRWPDSPVYWSLDPLGVERLNVGEATALGFPSFLLRTKVGRRSWDANVYAGLRQFHAAKGFDPNSQDVARHLGYPLYELSNEMEARFAHIVDEDLPADVASNVKDVLISEATANTLTLGLTEPSLPGTFKVTISIQLALILFLALCQVYETVGYSYD